MPDEQSMQQMQQPQMQPIEPMHAMNGHEAIGHLYMQTNELHNAVIHYRRAANGAIEEVDRVSTGGAGSGTFKPTSGQESSPNAFEGAGSVILTPDRRFLFTTNAGDNSVSSFAVSEDGELTLVDTKRTGKNRLPLPPSGCAGFVGAQIAGTLGLKVEIRSVPCRVFHI